MLGSLLILLVLPYVDLKRVRGNNFSPAGKILFWWFVVTFIILLLVGQEHPVDPFVGIGQIFTAMYFCYFLLFVPFLGYFENTVFDSITLSSSTILNPSIILSNSGEFNYMLKIKR